MRLYNEYIISIGVQLFQSHTRCCFIKNCVLGQRKNLRLAADVMKMPLFTMTVVWDTFGKTRYTHTVVW